MLISIELAVIGEELSEKEKVLLRLERDDLILQSQEFLEEEAYKLFSELFTQIADISDQIGEKDYVDEFCSLADPFKVALTGSPEPIFTEEVPVTSPSEPSLSLLISSNSSDTFLNEPDIIGA